MEVYDVAETEESKIKSKVKNHVDHVPQCNGYRPQPVLGTGLNDQSVILVRDPATCASLSAREGTRVVARQIVAASPQQCTCSQRPEDPVVLVREEYHRIGTTSLILLCVTFFLFPKLKARLRYVTEESLQQWKDGNVYSNEERNFESKSCSLLFGM